MNEIKISEASQFKILQDALRGGGCNVNLANKNVNSGQNSLIHPSLSTAGAIALNGEIITVAASSSVFELEETTIPAYGGAAFVCCTAVAAGAGVGYATNVLTSAQISESHSALLSDGMTSAAISTAGGPCYDVYMSPVLSWPAIPVTTVPCAIYVIAAPDSAHVAGSNTFSEAVSDNAVTKYWQRMNMNFNTGLT